jgi:ribonuclease HII
MKLIIGADEAGRGAWAGPLVAAAVCLKAGRKFNHKLLRDSKKLSPQQREEVFAYLQEVVEIGVGIVSSEEIDRAG